MARSTYPAEAQGLCNAGGALEALKMWWCIVIHKDVVLKSVIPQMLQTESIAIVDAKGVYDNVVNIMPSKSTKSEKRTYVEIALIKELLTATNTKLLWVDGDPFFFD